MVDIIGAVLSYLLADSPVAAEVGSRVYVGAVPSSAVPETQTATQPEKLLLLRYNGGSVHWRSANYIKAQIETWCIAPVYQDADAIDRDVYVAMRAIKKKVQDSVLLFSVGLGESPLMITDKATGWPTLIRQYEVIAGIN